MTLLKRLLVALATLAFLALLFFGLRGAVKLFSKTLSGNFREAVEREQPQAFFDDLDRLRAKVAANWAYTHFEGTSVDLEALDRVARAELGETPDQDDFVRALWRFSAGLGDGLANVIWGSREMQGPRRIPLALAEDSKGVFVFGVSPWVTKETGIAEGDQLISIDGTPIEQAIAHEMDYVCAATGAARRDQALRRVYRMTALERLTLGMQRTDGTAFEVEVDCPEWTAAVPTWSVRYWQREVRKIDEDIAFFRPAHFSPPEDQAENDPTHPFTELDNIVREIASTRCLILDLRGNPRGSDLYGRELAGRLLPASSTYSRTQQKPAFGSDDWSEEQVRAPAGRAPYAGELICLIDQRTLGLAEILAACLNDLHPRVTFVGRRTGASPGPTSSQHLPGTDAAVFVSTARVQSPKGEWIHGNGITPDVVVTWTRDDYLERRDADLEQALEVARER